MTASEEAFARGDRAIQSRLAELAAAREPSHQAIVRRQGGGNAHVYELVGTRRCIALRDREIRLAAEPDTMARYIEPRLRAVFEDTWWRKSLVLLAREVGS